MTKICIAKNHINSSLINSNLTRKLLVCLTCMALSTTGLHTLADDNISGDNPVVHDQNHSLDNNNQHFEAEPGVHKQLTEIITSKQFAESETTTAWKPKEEKPPDLWYAKLLEKFFEFLFNSNGSDATSKYSVLAIIIKSLLIFALIAFVVWVLRNAHDKGWFIGIRNGFNKRSKVSNYEPSFLEQSWESLPPHEHIPAMVTSLLKEQQLQRAASILYCGSLRWLKQNYHLPIMPANTEKQCLNQIRDIADLSNKNGHNQSSNTQQISESNRDLFDSSADDDSKQINSTKRLSSSLSKQSATYIEKLIHLWMQVAYSVQTSIETATCDSDDKPNQPLPSANINCKKIESLNDAASQLTRFWLSHLPVSQTQTESLKTDDNVTLENTASINQDSAHQKDNLQDKGEAS